VFDFALLDSLSPTVTRSNQEPYRALSNDTPGTSQETLSKHIAELPNSFGGLENNGGGPIESSHSNTPRNLKAPSRYPAPSIPSFDEPTMRTQDQVSAEQQLYLELSNALLSNNSTQSPQDYRNMTDRSSFTDCDMNARSNRSGMVIDPYDTSSTPQSIMGNVPFNARPDHAVQSGNSEISNSLSSVAAVATTRFKRKRQTEVERNESDQTHILKGTQQRLNEGELVIIRPTHKIGSLKAFLNPQADGYKRSHPNEPGKRNIQITWEEYWTYCRNIRYDTEKFYKRYNKYKGKTACDTKRVANETLRKNIEYMAETGARTAHGRPGWERKRQRAQVLKLQPIAPRELRAAPTAVSRSTLHDTQQVFDQSPDSQPEFQTRRVLNHRTGYDDSVSYPNDPPPVSQHQLPEQSASANRTASVSSYIASRGHGNLPQSKQQLNSQDQRNQPTCQRSLLISQSRTHLSQRMPPKHSMRPQPQAYNQNTANTALNMSVANIDGSQMFTNDERQALGHFGSDNRGGTASMLHGTAQLQHAFRQAPPLLQAYNQEQINSQESLHNYVGSDWSNNAGPGFNDFASAMPPGDFLSKTYNLNEMFPNDHMFDLGDSSADFNLWNEFDQRSQTFSEQFAPDHLQ
jgi:hypothetical protein